MAREISRVMLFLIIVCFVVSLCEARGGGRGGRGRYSSRRYGGGGGNLGVGMIFIIIFGIIGGMGVIIFIYILCKSYCDDPATENSSGDDAVANPATSTTTPTTTTNTMTTATTYQPLATSDASSDYDNSSATYGDRHLEVPPPSYEWAVSHGKGAMPSSSYNKGLPYSSGPAPNYGYGAEGTNRSSYNAAVPSAPFIE